MSDTWWLNAIRNQPGLEHEQSEPAAAASNGGTMVMMLSQILCPCEPS